MNLESLIGWIGIHYILHWIRKCKDYVYKNWKYFALGVLHKRPYFGKKYNSKAYTRILKMFLQLSDGSGSPLAYYVYGHVTALYLIKCSTKYLGNHSVWNITHCTIYFLHLSNISSLIICSGLDQIQRALQLMLAPKYNLNIMGTGIS